MTLIEQLRDILNQPQGPTYKSLHELCGEAADEIERLRRLAHILVYECEIIPDTQAGSDAIKAVQEMRINEQTASDKPEVIWGPEAASIRTRNLKRD